MASTFPIVSIPAHHADQTNVSVRCELAVDADFADGEEGPQRVCGDCAHADSEKQAWTHRFQNNDHCQPSGDPQFFLRDASC